LQPNLTYLYPSDKQPDATNSRSDPTSNRFDSANTRPPQPTPILSGRMIQLENRFTDSDKIWCGHYAIGDCCKIVLFNFLQSMMSALLTDGLVM
jgi:hypothetical protein